MRRHLAVSTRLLAAVAALAVLAAGALAQDAAAVISAAARAIGAENITSITYSGSAANINFGQTKSISGPYALSTAITNYVRSLDLSRPASRASGTTLAAQVPGFPPPQPGTLNQNIGPNNTAWTQQLEIWTTPWGFLKGAAANNATIRSQRISGTRYNVVSWMTPQKAPSGAAYTVRGYINEANLVARVETWVEHPILGDLQVESEYSDYRDFGGAKVPVRIVQKRAGWPTFEATITSASANPANIAELMTPPPPPQRAAGAAGAAGRGGAGGGPPAPPTVGSEKLADGVY
ncbi:MAG TPA: hypothetical protein VJL28_09725, partial [Gemmatimonadaceae bacterium]|nr:hypothetical protein [Gemmatimonadaceae bacterium]